MSQAKDPHERWDRLWVVSDHPSDFPQHFVARRWDYVQGQWQPTDDLIMSLYLERLRDRLCHDKKVLSRLPRHPNDEPQVLETWM